MYVSIPSTICDFLLSPEKKSVKTAFWWRPSSKKQDKKGHYICSMESVFRFSAKSITSFSLHIRNPLRRFSGGGGSGAAKSKRIKIRATYLIKDSVY